MKTTTVQTAERGRSPLGARIRFLMDGPHGNMIHSTVPPGVVGRACHFRTIDDIPLGTAFQYRCTGTEPLVFTCTALPPWPGDDEVVIVDGPWVPHLDPEPACQASD